MLILHVGSEVEYFFTGISQWIPVAWDSSYCLVLVMLISSSHVNPACRRQSKVQHHQFSDTNVLNLHSHLVNP